MQSGNRYQVCRVQALIALAGTGISLIAGCTPRPHAQAAPVAPAKAEPASSKADPAASKAACCDTPPRFGAPVQSASTQGPAVQAVGKEKAPAGMVLIPGGEFTMGSEASEAEPQEQPAHRVRVSPFWMDVTDVTNAQFRKFVEATGYVTTAERKPDWEELKKQVPPGTAKPPDDKLVAASLVFVAPKHPVPLNNPAAWWRWVPGASWRHPEGPGSSIQGKDNYPVVQVSWDDAMAYCKWAGKRLPTEAEWEFAARGGLEGKRFSWGDTELSEEHPQCNTWQGHFPDQNTVKDGYRGLSPVKHFAANGYGLYDMAGNAWQWCSDWFRPDAYQQYASGVAVDPAGPTESYDPAEPYTPKRSNRGGSFLCNAAYCASYRVSARRGTSPDSGLDHLSFRCVIPASKQQAAAR